MNAHLKDLLLQGSLVLGGGIYASTEDLRFSLEGTYVAEAGQLRARLLLLQPQLQVALGAHEAGQHTSDYRSAAKHVCLLEACRIARPGSARVLTASETGSFCCCSPSDRWPWGPTRLASTPPTTGWLPPMAARQRLVGRKG